MERKHSINCIRERIPAIVIAYALLLSSGLSLRRVSAALACRREEELRSGKEVGSQVCEQVKRLMAFKAGEVAVVEDRREVR